MYGYTAAPPEEQDDPEPHSSLHICLTKYNGGLFGDCSKLLRFREERGEVVLEQRLGTTPKAMKEVFGGRLCCFAMDRLPHFPNSHLRIQRYLQRGTWWNCQGNGTDRCWQGSGTRWLWSGFWGSGLKGLTPKPCTADEHQEDHLSHLTNTFHLDTSMLSRHLDQIIAAVGRRNASVSSR